MAECFNDFFIDGITENVSLDRNKVKLEQLNNSMYLHPCDPAEVFKTIMSLKNTNSVGPDEVSTKILKFTADLVSSIISYIINVSFEQGIFPNTLKLFMVKPLHKKGSKSSMDKYRPVALLSVMSKIFEKIFQKRLVRFLNKFNIIKDQQFGFQKNKSTTMAVYTLVKHVTSLIDNRQPAVVIFFDMTKAFDFVDHQTLLNKCQYYGIRGPAQDWIKSYLDRRKQFVRLEKNIDTAIESFDSSTREVRFGVPQGSVLGPLLFLLYINDLTQITSYQTTLFADDISIIVSNNKDSIEKEVNVTIKSVVDWLSINNLNVNIDKTTYVQFQNYNNDRIHIEAKHEDVTIKESDNVKFLGIALDRHCNWKCQIDIICNKLNRFVYVLYKLNKISGLQVALTAYHGYVSSILSYGILIWGNCTDINKAFIAQKKCIRAICGRKQTDSCRPLFKKFNILTLTGMYIF